MRDSAAWWGLLLFGLLFQTTLLTDLMPDPWRPDVTRALVLWVTFTGRPRGSAVLAFSAGLALDFASGAPLGFGACMRLTLFMVFRPFSGILEHSRATLFFGPLCVAVDTLFIKIFGAFLFRAAPETSTIVGLALRQGVSELIMVPLVFLVLTLMMGSRREEEVVV